MANILDKTNLTNHVDLNDGVQNWISQIKAGELTYDIATHHGITFKEGSSDTNGVVWNGLTDLEIVIPSITDIVQTPIEFAGTVDKTGKITWISGHTKEEAGSLVFITEDCTFGGKVCEAGDMAIFDGSKWNIVTGENQVNIVGNNGESKTTFAIGASKDVLTVEGKTLALTIDYDNLNKHIEEKRGGNVNVDVTNTTVNSMQIGLSQESAKSETIGESKTLTLATALNNGTVNFTGAENLVSSVTFGEFSSGSFPELKKNSAIVELSVKDGALSKVNGSDFVTSVSLGSISVVTAGDNDANKFSMVTGVSSTEGDTEFLKGIVTTNNSSEAAFTIKGYYIPKSENYVTGLGDGSDVVTEVTGGSFTLDSGSDLVTGFGVESASGEVISKVSVSTGTTDVFSAAKVENHVLSFTTSTVHSGDVTTTASYKSLTKTGYTYTPASCSKRGLTTNGFTKDNDVMYKFNKGKEKLWSTTSEYYKVNTPSVTAPTSSYEINHDNMRAVVSADTFVTSMTSGTLPSLTDGSVGWATISGSVDTTLATTTDTFYALKSDAINMPGAYSIVEVSSNGVVVGKAGKLGGEAPTVNLSGYLIDVNIVETVQA